MITPIRIFADISRLDGFFRAMAHFAWLPP
jgi:hypothetical protein